MDTDVIIERIERYLKEHRLSHAEFEDGAGIARGLLSKWKKHSISPSLQSLKAIIKFMNISIVELFLGDSLPPSVAESISSLYEHMPRVIPQYNDIPLPSPGKDYTQFEEDSDGWIFLSEDYDEDASYYAVSISSDDMSPLLNPGDIVIVELGAMLSTGDVAAVAIGESAPCFRKFSRRESGIILQKGDINAAPDYFSDDMVTSLPVTIIGKVTAFNRRL